MPTNTNPLNLPAGKAGPPCFKVEGINSSPLNVRGVGGVVWVALFISLC